MDEVTKIDENRERFMADDTPVDERDWEKLLQIADRLHKEDNTLNIYELYHHPEARAKLFAQIGEAILQVGSESSLPETQLIDRDELVSDLEWRFNNIIEKQIAAADQEKIGDFLEFIRKENPDITPEQEQNILKGLVVSGLMSKEE